MRVVSASSRVDTRCCHGPCSVHDGMCNVMSIEYCTPLLMDRLGVRSYVCTG